jgi:CBS domain-containing protein
MVPVKSFMVPVDKNIGSLFITRGKDIIGIVTDTDMVRRSVATGADPSKTPVEQIMSAPIITIEEHKTLLDANDLMAREHLRHLGVTRDGKLVGMISVRDLVVFLTNLPRK